MKKTALTILMLVILSLPAMAGTDYNVCFSKLDVNVDDEMTISEFEAAFPGGDNAVFAAADTDRNGTVSHEEWEDYKASQDFEEGDHHDG